MDTSTIQTVESKNKKWLLPSMFALLVFISCGIVISQQLTINKLNRDVSELQQSQIPTQVYANFEDCTDNGGQILSTINGQFNACLGGDIDETGELPQYQAFLQYSAQNLPRLEESTVADRQNKVTYTDVHSDDLVSFLKHENTGCEDRGEFEIVKEVPSRFALMKYGCAGDGQVASDDPPTIIAIKLGDGWRHISPTNHMQGQIPSCLMVDMFKISKQLSNECFENTGYNNGTVKEVEYR